MGCDIHMFCEEKREDGWFNRDHWELNPYYPDPNDEFEKEYNIVELYGTRNYAMFTALCGVRDYTDSAPKISTPRGVPDDSCKQIKEAVEFFGSDGHSHSYATLLDVKQFVDRNEPMRFSGLISAKQSELLDSDGVAPDSWCQGTNQDGFVFREWEDDSIKPLNGLLEAMYERFRPYWDVEQFSDEDLANFRIVFYFDN